MPDVKLYTQEPLNERPPSDPRNISYEADCPLCGKLVLMGWDEDGGGNIRGDGTAQCTNPECDYRWKADYLLAAEARWEAEWAAGAPARAAEEAKREAEREFARAAYAVKECERLVSQTRREIGGLESELQRKRKALPNYERRLEELQRALDALKATDP